MTRLINWRKPFKAVSRKSNKTMKLLALIVGLIILVLVGPFFIWFHGFALSYVFNSLVVTTTGWEPMNALQGASIVSVCGLIASLSLVGTHYKLRNNNNENNNLFYDAMIVMLASIIISGLAMLSAFMFKLYFL